MIWNFFGQSDRADFSVAETTSNSSLSSLPHQSTPIPHHPTPRTYVRTDENIRAAELPIRFETPDSLEGGQTISKEAVNYSFIILNHWSVFIPFRGRAQNL